VVQNQGLLSIAFFEATAFGILLVLFLLLRRDHVSSFFRLWLAGWVCFTLSALTEVLQLIRDFPGLQIVSVLFRFAALILFFISVVKCTDSSSRRSWPVLPVGGIFLALVYYIEHNSPASERSLHWETALLASGLCVGTGWIIWRWSARKKGHGARLLAGSFFAMGLHGIDIPLWAQSPLFHLRIAFDHLLGVAIGIAMVVMVMESARSRTEEIHQKMHRLMMLTTASTQTLSVKDLLEKVLAQLVESLDATHGLVRLLEVDGNSTPQLLIRASVGFPSSYLAKYAKLSPVEPWVQQVLKEGFQFVRFEEETDLTARKRMSETGQKELVTLALSGKEGPLGIIAIGSTRTVRFQPDELSYLVNIANLLGMTLQNVRLFEQVSTVQKQWAYTFDSIGDPIFVHDAQGRILRSNARLGHLLHKENSSFIGRNVTEMLPRKNANYKLCPYCEGTAGEGDETDPWLSGHFLASNSIFSDSEGRELGTVHVLKDISDRKRAEEKYRTLVSSVQEGVFISTPQGHFLDFNEAFLRMAGYERREELLGVNIPSVLYVNAADRERLKKLLQEHGSVADFEFEMRRKDGEVRTVMESSIAVRDAAGNVSAYQGFLLDITERKQAEHEIRRRNRELMVLNSIAQTLTESMDLGDSLHRTLRQLAELFSLDACSLYLLDEKKSTIRRVAAVGHRSEYARNFPQVPIPPELLQQIRSVHARFVPAQGLPLPQIFRDTHKKEELVSAYVVMLWSKDRIVGVLVVGSRSHRDFSPADANLLIAVGSQISGAIDRTSLFEETRQAYENLRRTQEQLLHSEKMAAVGQLISGVAHELNNPLTAILGYSQLLISSGQMGPQGIEYSDKLYKQAQRTHRIVQNLLSFARQHKPERIPVELNQVLQDTLALRDYDLRMSNVRVHLDLDGNLPVTPADPHQLQQVFLNMVNNAVDAILDNAKEGDLWVRTGVNGSQVFIEFTDSGPGVQDASRVFDPFYTTKPVGKGTGLGLSICYGIITEHGGTIRVRNQATKGASFIIELPFPAATQFLRAKVSTVSAQRNDRKILLASTDRSVLESVEEILRGTNYSVTTANNLDDAKTLLDQGQFGLVVADGSLISAICEGRSADTAATSMIIDRLIVIADSEKPGGHPATSSAEETGRILHKPIQAAELLSTLEELLNRVHASTTEG